MLSVNSPFKFVHALMKTLKEFHDFGKIDQNYFIQFVRDCREGQKFESQENVHIKEELKKSIEFRANFNKH